MSTDNRKAQIPKEQAKALPHASGVYIMHDVNDKIIYVGKAKDLQKRVSSYFLAGRDAKTSALVRKISWIEHIVTANEYEALVLENNLIKKHNPHYNIDLKDGKSYPVIRITHEQFPKVFRTRRIINDGSEYFGPFPSVSRLDTYLELLDKMFPLRRCSIPLKKRESPCLFYHIGKCSAPCCGKISAEEYGKYIDSVRDMLNGRDKAITDRLRNEMAVASKAMRYEQAAEKRDLLNALELIDSGVTVEDFISEGRDYAAIEMRAPLCTVAIMQMREGRMMGRALYRAETLGDESETLLHFLTEYYSNAKELPEELYVSHDIDSTLIQRFFNEQLGGEVKVEVPIDGKHYRILKMAVENASRDVEKRLRSRDNSNALETLKDELGLEEIPSLIEGFDIAQLSGKYTVASLIAFRDGNPSRSDYRRFNIRSLDGKIDDFGAMREAVSRRYSRVIRENLDKPGLIMVDGGIGQVNAAREVLDELGLADVPVVGLAEEHETIVFDNGRLDLNLPLDNEGLRILIALRDECHRFATSANQSMRSSDATFKLLESIDGVGPVRAKRIMTSFGTLDEVRAKLSAAEGIDAFSKETGIPQAVASRIAKALV